MVGLDTIEHLSIQQMLNCEFPLFWLGGSMPLRLEAHYPRQICDPPPALSPLLSLPLSESIKYRQSYFSKSRKRAPFQFSMSALGIKVFYAQPLSQRFQQRFTELSENNCSFVKGIGCRSFNSKDVLNELPLYDWWAVGIPPPFALYPTAEAFNYKTCVLMLSAPLWYASRMQEECCCCCFYHLIASAQYHCHRLKMQCQQNRVLLLMDQGRCYSCVH